MSTSTVVTGKSRSNSIETKTFTSTTATTVPVIERVLLPTQIVEKEVAVHEEIRKEIVEEIQPVVEVEKFKTEVHQVTQPLFDKEVMPVMIEKKILATEVLPQVDVAGRGIRMTEDMSTTRMLDTKAVIIEKPAQVIEIEKRQIIEEIQPVIYKETIVPEVIQETKPMYQKIVEGAVYSQTTLPAQEVAIKSTIAPGYVPDMTPVAAVHENIALPVLTVQKQAAIHEEIRSETIEEIQPVISVEKVKTEIHQVTQPLFDKEVRPVMIEKKLLATEVLPEVITAGVGSRDVDEMSTTTFLPTNAMTIEKPAMFRETERTQIIEEIQPVIYKETVVPQVIQETKPIYQKIVEGAVYTQTTLPAQEVAVKSMIAPAYVPDKTVVAPVHTDMLLPVKIVEREAAIHETIRKEKVEEIQPVINVEKFQTEIHQVTQPLFDKEVKPVLMQKKVLATEILPEVLVEGRGVRMTSDVSTTSYSEKEVVVIEKAAQMIEIEKTQIIEEIQPVIYKETIVPSIIQETKPIYQKIIEGPVFVKETLPAQSLSGSKYHYPTTYVSGATTLVQTTTTTTTTPVVMGTMGTAPTPVVVMGTQPTPVIMTETVTRL